MNYYFKKLMDLFTDRKMYAGNGNNENGRPEGFLRLVDQGGKILNFEDRMY